MTKAIEYGGVHYQYETEAEGNALLRAIAAHERQQVSVAFDPKLELNPTHVLSWLTSYKPVKELCKVLGLRHQEGGK